MKHLILSILLLLSPALLAAEHISALIDQPTYLAGERLYVSVKVDAAETDLGSDANLSSETNLSRVAYIELSDTHHLCAQAMAWLDAEGRGWACIALPQSLHSGYYLLSAYTQSMRNESEAKPWQQLVPIVNVLHVTRDDDVTFLPADTLSVPVSPLSAAPSQTITWAVPGAALGARMASVSLIGQSLSVEPSTPLCETLPVWTSPTSNKPAELEGHQVQVRVVGQHDVHECTLSTVGKAINLFAGQRQADDTWTFYTDHLCGNLPVALTAVSPEGHNVPMDFISPYARLLPTQLPSLSLRSPMDQLRTRSMGAQQQQAITASLPADSLPYSPTFMEVEPAYTYVMEEWARFSTIREIITEFVHGAHHGRENGRHCLYIFDPDAGFVSSWPAMILLDGVPVYDTEKILDYDARLLEYVHIYQGRFAYGSQMYFGVISFVTQRGRLSNYRLDAGTRLVNYAFPQDHPAFITYEGQAAGTLYWNPSPDLSAPITLSAPAAPGTYTLLLQWIDAEGHMQSQSTEVRIR